MQPGPEIVPIKVAGHTATVRMHPAPSESAPTILALHGFTGSGQDFGPLREALGPDKAHWICPDFMGHGGSASPDVIDPYLLPAALKLIDRARLLAPDPAKVLLLGYSMGARLALNYLRYVARLPSLLIGGSPGLSNPADRALRRDSDQKWMALLKQSMAEFCDAWERQELIQPQLSLPEPLASAIADRRRTNSQTGLANSLLACGQGALPGLWEALHLIYPAHLVYGNDDSRFSEISYRMREQNENLILSPVPGCGHAPHLENPGAVAHLIGVGFQSPYFN